MCVLGWAALWSCWFQGKKWHQALVDVTDFYLQSMPKTLYLHLNWIIKTMISPVIVEIKACVWNKFTQNVYLQLQLKSNISPELLIKANRPNAHRSDCVPLQVYSSMEHLSQLEQKATCSVSRREHKGPREDKVTKRESMGSFSMRDKSWRTGSPEMWVVGSTE